MSIMRLILNNVVGETTMYFKRRGGAVIYRDNSDQKMKVILATEQKHFADAFKIRTNVFIGEQQVPVHEEIDEYDGYVPIFVAYENDKATGTARVIMKENQIAKIGRVAVVKEARKKGIGKQLMLEAIKYISNKTDAQEIRLDAQLTAVEFYKSLGFISHGEIFKDAGIDHIAMTYSISN